MDPQVLTDRPDGLGDAFQERDHPRRGGVIDVGGRVSFGELRTAITAQPSRLLFVEAKLP